MAQATSALAFVQQSPFTPPPVCLLYGNETQLLEECRNAVRNQFVSDNRHRVDVETLIKSPVAESKGLFSGQRPELFEFIGHTTPTKEALEELLEAAKRLQSSDSLLIVFYHLESNHLKSAWFKKINEVATAVRADRLTPARATPWIKRWLNENKITMQSEGVELLAMQSEGNLLAAKQAISKLALAGDGDTAGPITVDSLRAVLADGAQYDLFDLTDAVLAGKGSRALVILQRLRAEGVAEPLLMWSISDILNSVITIQNGGTVRAWGERAKNLQALAKRLNENALFKLLQQAAFTDRLSKGVAAGDMETALMRLVINLAAIQRGVKIKHPNYLP